MSDVRGALLRMVRAYRNAGKLTEAYLTVGLTESGNTLEEIRGDILDAIYKTVGEHTENFDESVTKTVMEAPLFTDERRVSMLMAQFRGNAMKQYDENITGFSCPKNEPEQPKPITMERKDVEKMACENGGYVTQKASVLPPEERRIKRENHRLKRVNKILMDQL